MKSQNLKSKALSNTSSNSRRDEENAHVTLLLDRTHQAKTTAKLLRDLSVKVEVHKRYYLPAEPDPDWIKDATKRGWAIISGDKGIELDGINRHAVASCGAKVFLLTDTESRGADWAAALVAARHRIRRLAASNNGPFYCTVDKANDRHVGQLRFMEGGGPIAKQPTAGTESATLPSTPDQPSPPAEQATINFNTPTSEK